MPPAVHDCLYSANCEFPRLGEDGGQGVACHSIENRGTWATPKLEIAIERQRTPQLMRLFAIWWHLCAFPAN